MSVSALQLTDIDNSETIGIREGHAWENQTSDVPADLLNALELLPNAIVVADMLGHVQGMNSRAQEFFGCDPDRACGTAPELLVGERLGGRGRHTLRLRLPGLQGLGTTDNVGKIFRLKDRRGASSVEANFSPLWFAGICLLLCIFRRL